MLGKNAIFTGSLLLSILLLCMINIRCTVEPEIPSLGYAKTYSEDSFLHAGRIIETDDGGYYIFGHNDSNLSFLKTNSNGSVLWKKVYTAGGSIYFQDLDQTSDGGYILLGDIWWKRVSAFLCRINSDGDLLWKKEIGETGGLDAMAICQASDSSFLIVGHYSLLHPPQALILEIKKSGYLVSEKRLTDYPNLSDIIKVGKNEFIAIIDSPWLIKLDSGINVIWEKVVRTGELNKVVCFKKTKDNGYIIGSYVPLSESVGLKYWSWIIKTDIQGNLQWVSKKVGTKPEEVYQTKDGGYIVVGTSGYSIWKNYSVDAWLIKLDGQGNTVWERTFGDDQRSDYGFAVSELHDGGFILAGGSYPSRESERPFYWLIKTDANGNTVWK